jgi:NADH-quinone oxidoreductase subunit E
MSKSLNEILSTFNGNKSELIPILQDIQSNIGYLPEDAIIDVSKFTQVPESEI